MRVDHHALEIQKTIDELVGSVGPSEQMNVGSSYDGAAQFDKQIAGWYPPLQSADADLRPSDRELLDARTRDMMRNDAYVQGGARHHKDSIVGTAYFLSAKPDYKALGRDETWMTEFQAEVESLFTLWAESPQKWIDASRENTFTDMIRLDVGVYCSAGETLSTVEFLRDRGREFHTAVQMIDPDRLSTPYAQANNDDVVDGVRKDRNGAAVSYFIQWEHPNDVSFSKYNKLRWKEVKARKPWGRPQVIHIREQIRVDQTRAVADIVAGLREVAITRRFRDVTLQNAVVNAMYAASIESELPNEVILQQMGAGVGADPGQAVTDYATDYLTAINEYTGSARGLRLDGTKIPHLFPGTKLNMNLAGNPGGVGQDFEASLLRYVATSLGISYEELSKDYSKTNYSSARAAMLNTWQFMQSRKKVVADAKANHIYRLWIEEAVNNNRLSTFPAASAGTLYTNGYLNLMFDALTRATWTGASRGQIDELKETQAAVLRIKYGLSTHEKELARLGLDWRDVNVQIEREMKDREARGIELFEDNSVNAASGTPREADSDEQDSGEQDAA